MRIFSLFFPDGVAWVVERRLGLKVEAVVGASCSVPVLRLDNGVRIEWPLLLPVVLSGVVVPLCCASDLFSTGRSLDCIYYWAISHLCYAVMCVASLFAHCLPHTMSPFWLKQMMILDVTATACSSSSFVFASLTYTPRGNGGRKGPWLLLRLVHLAFIAVLIAIGESQRPFANEILWLGVTSVSVVCVLLRDLVCGLSPVPSHAKRWLGAALLCIAVLGSAIFLEFGWCGIVSASAIPVSFFGHNVGMVCLWCYARALVDDTEPRKQAV
ncbi:unnamed protein product [Vitrella brassicaformis CCMP3155]|uniref:Uncharacterized protein n=1 Tax=Vitrella brassicaformis (strain CCMP3155) TaxID=1169540 RepID=A0A0G4H5U2_VITBC|nr:unnamed protein product [Vitrella brassicaformis CCMP3155]|eukprot:CEM39190.1 unnamed protein product [Vitrella brassicaformis CCMP3155]